MKKCFVILVLGLFGMVSILLAQGGPWTAKTSLPKRNSWLSSCVVEGKIYVVGGATDNTVLSAVEVYDPASDSWDTTKAKMSGNRWGLSANVVDGKIYAIGGVEGETGSALSKVEVYDPLKDTWELKAKMPTARVGFASCVLDNKIYILGGAASEPFQTPLNKVEVYDPHSDSWDTSKSSLSTAIAYPAACTVNGKIYLIGGTSQSPWTGSVKIEEYDPATDKWTRKKDMPTGRWALAACVANGKIYVLGGTESPSNGGSSKVEEYDPSTDTWKTRAEMPTPRLALSASEVDGKVYALGGATVGYPWIPSVATVEEFDPALDITSVGENSNASSPVEYSLSQNYPNPFNPTTTIGFSVPRFSYVTLKVFGLLGDEVATLASQNLAVGSYRVDWNAKGVASGVYLYRLVAGSFVETKKLLLIK
jgi:N-acetylneuraminic acid mutarotase